ICDVFTLPGAKLGAALCARYDPSRLRQFGYLGNAFQVFGVRATFARLEDRERVFGVGTQKHLALNAVLEDAFVDFEFAQCRPYRAQAPVWAFAKLMLVGIRVTAETQILSHLREEFVGDVEVSPAKRITDGLKVRRLGKLKSIINRGS